MCNYHLACCVFKGFSCDYNGKGKRLWRRTWRPAVQTAERAKPIDVQLVGGLSQLMFLD